MVLQYLVLFCFDLRSFNWLLTTSTFFAWLSQLEELWDHAKWGIYSNTLFRPLVADVYVVVSIQRPDVFFLPVHQYVVKIWVQHQQNKSINKNFVPPVHRSHPSHIILSRLWMRCLVFAWVIHSMHQWSIEIIFICFLVLITSWWLRTVVGYWGMDGMDMDPQ